MSVWSSIQLPFTVLLAFVSILVLMDVGLKRFLEVNLRWRLACFNPCFNGCRSEANRCKTCYVGDKRVSILVLMDVGLKHPYYNPWCKHSQVSILVLMDVGLKLKDNGLISLSRNCFNPCFNGCRSEASYHWSTGSPCTEVSILVLMDVGLKPGQGVCIPWQFLVVSILVLMDVGLKQKKNQKNQTQKLGVSILVLMDVGLKQPMENGLDTPPIVSILVLMDVGLKLIIRHPAKYNLYGFNPCFNGCRSEAYPNFPVRLRVSCFNPCFNGCRSEAVVKILQI